jgi:hypothetical protein
MLPVVIVTTMLQRMKNHISITSPVLPVDGMGVTSVCRLGVTANVQSVKTQTKTKTLETKMKLKIARSKLEIVPDRGMLPGEDERDDAFIEEVLGLKKEGDYVHLVRRDAMGVSALAYLETKRIDHER